jgi:uncharacterized protein (DUF305 family)
MNYQTTTYVLGAALILSLATHTSFLSIFGTKPIDEMQRGAITQGGGMHMMPDGTVMPNMPMEHGTDSGMEAMMHDMTARLQGKTGLELEKIFLEDMIVHHQGAVDMSQELLKGTTRPELVQFANDIITLQSQEIEMQKQWLKAWF